MSANVETMFYTREKPWHGLGTRVETELTSADALVAAGLDWRVTADPIYDSFGREIEGYRANVRSSDASVLGIVSDRYTIVQNAEAFEFTDSLVGEGLVYDTAGSLKGGKRIWLLGKLPERYIVGDKVEPYICFTNTHDGTGAVRACMTPIRVVCNNTLNLALSQASRAWSTPHKGDVQKRLEEARNTLKLADEYMNALKDQAEYFAYQRMTEGEAEHVIDEIIDLPKDATDRQKKTANEVKEQITVCMLAPDLAKFVGTKWGFLNAISDYVGHGEPARRTKNFDENRWNSIISGHWMLDKAMQLVG